MEEKNEDKQKADEGEKEYREVKYDQLDLLRGKFYMVCDCSFLNIR